MCQRTQRTVRNPVAVATIIDLVHWYAAEIPAETPLERAALRVLSKVDPDRRISQRMVENFSAIPSKYKAPIFGEFIPGHLRSIPEDELRQAFTRPRRVFVVQDDVGLGDPPDFPPDTQFTVDYTGLYCRDRTGDRGLFGSSDEPYVITVAVSTEGGENIERSVLHPFGDPDQRYGDVDDGDSRNGPIAVCWAGVEPAREISIVTVVIEHDEGDQDAYKEEIETIVDLAAEALKLWGIDVPEGIRDLVGDVISFVIDSGDDEIGTDVVVLTPAWIKRWASLPTRKFSEKRTVLRPLGTFTYKEEEVVDNTDIDHHFYSRHTRDGEYVVLYRVTADQDPLLPSVLSEFEQGILVVNH